MHRPEVHVLLKQERSSHVTLSHKSTPTHTPTTPVQVSFVVEASLSLQPVPTASGVDSQRSVPVKPRAARLTLHVAGYAQTCVAHVTPLHGFKVGALVGGAVGASVVGASVGESVEGLAVGPNVSPSSVGWDVGRGVGAEVVGLTDGAVVGTAVVGEVDGDTVGASVVGEVDGDADGGLVGR
jgi:hypothetical protein